MTCTHPYPTAISLLGGFRPDFTSLLEGIQGQGLVQDDLLGQTAQEG